MSTFSNSIRSVAGTGVAGQVLTSNGTVSKASWQDVSASGAIVTINSEPPDGSGNFVLSSNNLEITNTAANVDIEDLRFTTQYVVDTSVSLGQKGTYTTIQAAVTAASGAGGGNVFVRAGTYTENVTMANNVTLTSYAGLTSTASSSQTIISGSLQFNNITNCNVSNITIIANGAVSPLQFTGTGLTQVQFTNVTAQSSLAPVMTCSNTNVGTNIEFYITYFLQDGAFPQFTVSGGFIEFNTCYLGVSEGVSPAQTTSVISGAGTVFFTQSAVGGSIQTTGTGGLIGYYTVFDASGLAIDIQSTNSAAFAYSEIESGSGAAINIGASSSVSASYCRLYSVAANAVAGTGSFKYDIISFTSGSAVTIDPGLTVTVRVVRPFATAVASSSISDVRGVACFNSAQFTVDANGFVSSIAGPGSLNINPDTGTNITNSAYSMHGAASGAIKFNGVSSSAMTAAVQYDNVTIGVNGSDQLTVLNGAENWIDQGSSITVVPSTGYFATAAITLTLPVSPSQGNFVEFAVDNAGTLVIQASPGQTIRIFNNTSTVAGTATSTIQGNTLKLVYRAATATWLQTSVDGTWDLA